MSGPAYVPGDPACRATSIRGDNEILEGTQHADVLYGDRRDNPLILGNEGDDTLFGLGGNDVLEERGWTPTWGNRDLLYAFDRARDVILSCGPGGHRVVRDRLTRGPRLPQGRGRGEEEEQEEEEEEEPQKGGEKKGGGGKGKRGGR